MINDREADLVPEIISIGTSRMFRVRRIGAVYFVQQNMMKRVYDGQDERLDDDWSGIAVAKGENARNEALIFLNDANQKFIAVSLSKR